MNRRLRSIRSLARGWRDGEGEVFFVVVGGVVGEGGTGGGVMTIVSGVLLGIFEG